MARKAVGVAPSGPSDVVPKSYVDASVTKFAPTFPVVLDTASSTNEVAINAAIVAADAAGGGTVELSTPGVYTTSASIDLTGTYVTLRMARGVVIYPNFVGPAISHTGPATSVTIEGGTLRGKVNMPADTTKPSHARTTSGAGCTFGIDMVGTGAFTNPANGAPLTDITIRSVRVENCSVEPIRVFGCAGRVLVEGCYFVNNNDAGFGYNESLIVVGNTNYLSQDNGFSLSRGNKNVVCVGNVAECCAYAGIFVAGFIGEPGPEGWTIQGNVVRNPGSNGIQMSSGPQHGVVSGNTLIGGYFRGPTDIPNDTANIGISIGGLSDTQKASGLLIAENVIREFAGGGIFIGSYVDDVLVKNNMVRDIGSQYLSDGVTLAPSASSSNNCGIMVYQSGVSQSNLRFEGNSVVDARSPQYMNYPFTPWPANNAALINNDFHTGRAPIPLVFQRMLQADDLSIMQGSYETIPRYAATSATVPATSGAMRWGFFTAQDASVISKITVQGGTTAAAATPTLVRCGLYTWVPGVGMTLVASSASNTAAFAVASTETDFALTTPFQLTAGQRYAVALLVVTTVTAPTYYGTTASLGLANSHEPRMSGTTTGQTDLPSTVSPGAIGVSTTIPYFRMS